MDTSRTHEVTHAQFPWSWVLIGTVAMILVAGLIALQGNGDDIVVRTHAEEIPLGTPTASDGVRETPISVPALYGTSSSTFTGIREGGTYAGAIPLGTPTTFDGVRETPIAVPALTGDASSTFTEVREGGEYHTAAQDPTPGPAPGR